MDLNFLEGAQAPEVTTPVATPEPAPEPAPQIAAPEPEAAPAAPIPEPAPQPANVETAIQPGHVPISALLDTRDKLKAAEARAEALQQQIAQAQQQQYVPDPDEDPQAHQAFQQAQIQQAVLNTRLDLSEDMARGKYGDDTVAAAQQWFAERVAKNPAYYPEAITARNPYEKVIQDFKRDQIASSLSDTDLEQFNAWKAAQGQLQAAQPIAPAQSPPTPPRSLASAPNAGGGVGHVPVGPGTAYSGLFQ